METSEESTQGIYEEEWGVQVGKEVFSLNGKQIKLLREADLAGQRGIVWFERFAISIPHIQSIWLISRHIKNQLEAGERPEEPMMTDEDRERARKKIQEMKKQFMIKFGKNKDRT
jgi:hypothetical protein